MTTEKPGIGRAMMRYAGGVKKEMKQAQGARAKMSAAGSGVAGAPMALLAESARDLLKPKGTFWGIFTKNKSVMGINLGLGSLLKQSQVFTSSISSILQIIGALVDVFIAPFLVPLIVPVIKKLASFIGPVREYAQALAEKWVPRISRFFSDIWSGDEGFWTKIWKTIKGMVVGAFKATGLYDWYMDQDVWTVVGAFRESMGLLMDMLRFFGVIEDKPDMTPEKMTETMTQNYGFESFYNQSIGGGAGAGYDIGGTPLGGAARDTGNLQTGIYNLDRGNVSRQKGGGSISILDDPMAMWMYNSQNGGGGYLKIDRDDEKIPPMGGFLAIEP